MKQEKSKQPAVLALSMLALTLIAPWVFGQDPDPPRAGHDAFSACSDSQYPVVGGMHDSAC